jgi:DNA-binding ferritin-like protein
MGTAQVPKARVRTERPRTGIQPDDARQLSEGLSRRELVAVADKANDVVTADLLTDRINTHEEAAWMLRSIVSA